MFSWVAQMRLQRPVRVSGGDRPSPAAGMVVLDSGYVCNYGNGESPELLEKSIDHLKNQLSATPGLVNCRYDASFLLRFLRFCRFDVDNAAGQVVRTLEMMDHYPRFFRQLDIEDPGIRDLMDNGFVIGLLSGKDRTGHPIIYGRGHAANDPSAHGQGASLRSLSMAIYSLFENPELASSPITLVLNCHGCKLSQLSVIPLSDLTSFVTNFTRNFPVLFHQIHLVNVPFVIKHVLNLLVKCLRSELRQKIIFQKDLKSLERDVPLEILPEECGGLVNLQQLVDSWITFLASHRNEMLKLDEIHYVPGQKAATETPPRKISVGKRRLSENHKAPQQQPLMDPDPEVPSPAAVGRRRSSVLRIFSRPANPNGSQKRRASSFYPPTGKNEQDRTKARRTSLFRFLGRRTSN